MRLTRLGASSLLTDFRTGSRSTDTAGGETEVWLSRVEPRTERSCRGADDRYPIFAGPEDSHHWYGVGFISITCYVPGAAASGAGTDAGSSAFEWSALQRQWSWLEVPHRPRSLLLRSDDPDQRGPGC
jgi:hypothetical protein